MQRNLLMPVVALIGLQAGMLIGLQAGTLIGLIVLVEYVFNWLGLLDQSCSAR